VKELGGRLWVQAFGEKGATWEMEVTFVAAWGQGPPPWPAGELGGRWQTQVAGAGTGEEDRRPAGWRIRAACGGDNNSDACE
jgi:hypothetical protein